jgi:O-antigen ligase
MGKKKKHKKQLAEQAQAAAAASQSPPWTYYAIGILAALASANALLPAYSLGGPVILKGNVWYWLTLIMVALWIPLAASSARYRPNFKHPLVMAALIWIGYLLISLPLSGNPYLSFWSNRDRVIGVFANLHWFAWFLVLGTTLRGWRSWRPVFATSLLVSLIVALIALMEVSSKGATGRVESTQGNAIYLANYLVPHVFIALMMWARSQKWWMQAAYLGAAAINAIVIVYTNTRGATLAMLLGLLVAAGGYFMLFSRNRKRAVLAVSGLVLAFLLLVSGGLWARLTETGRAWGLNNIPQVFHRYVYHDFGTDRLSLYRMGLQGWQEKPFFGHGLENYSGVLNRYFDPALDWALTENWYDRTHSQLIDTLVGTGAVGLLLYLGLWGAAYCVLIRGLRRERDPETRKTLWLIVPLLFAGSVASVFSFDTPSAALPAWLGLALAYSLTRPPPTDDEPEAKAPEAFLISLLIAAAVIGGWYLHWRPYAHAVDYNRRMAKIVSEPEDTSAYLGELFGRMGFTAFDVRYNMLGRLRNLSENSRTPRARLESPFRMITEAMEPHLANRPDDFKALLATSYGYRELATFDDSVLPRAQELTERATAAAPYRPEGYEEQAEVAIVSGDYDRALELLDEAKTYSRHDLTDGRITMRMAGVKAMQGDKAGAEEKLLEAKEIYDWRRDFRQAIPFADSLRPGDDYPVIMEYLKLMAESRPRVAMAQALYILAFCHSGELDKARAWLPKLEPLDKVAAQGLKEAFSL